MPERLLVIEDDASTAAYIAQGFVQEGFVVDRADDGRDGLFLATDSQYDAIVLDRMLPSMPGLAVLKALRAADVPTPVILLSAVGSPEDRVEGLNAGADDYMVKPFTFAELMARVRVVMRRRQGAGVAADTVLSCGSLELDRLTRRVRRGTRALDLQPREFRLLEFLLQHKDAVVTRTMLLEGVWDYHFDPATNVVDVHISRIRKKIEEGDEPPLLHTVRGAGYRLSEHG